MQTIRMKGFTLIELLIVIAIILILISIALPNFLAAQIRGKVAAAQQDLYAGTTALEQFHIDKKFYPPDGRWNMGLQKFVNSQMRKSPPNINYINYWRFNDHSELTTPIPYLKKLPREPFLQGHFWWDGSFLYENVENMAIEFSNPAMVEVIKVTEGHQNVLAGKVRVLWIVSSLGPDCTKSDTASRVEYNPTNGTSSAGDLYRVGP
jgi:prepilin-type N-terminal cleavage/methylation domain-containing protein